MSVTSPYFEGFDETEVVETEVVENEIVREVSKLFASRDEHLEKIDKLSKLFVGFNHSAWMNSTNETLVSEVGQTTTDLSQQINQANYTLKNKAQLVKALAAVNSFIDFAYIYYVQHYDLAAPIYKLPKTATKYDLFAQALNAPKDELYNLFLHCITDPFIKDLRIDNPPYLMRTDLTERELIEKIEAEVGTRFTSIIDKLRHLSWRQGEPIGEPTGEQNH